MGAGRGTRLPERDAIPPVRPHGGGDRGRARCEFAERYAVVGVRDDQGPIRGPSAEAFAHVCELLLRATGEPDASFVRRRAREILGRKPADEAGRAEEDDIEVAHRDAR